MVAALAQHGIFPRKTNDPRMVTGVPDHLLSHFWRGAIDGDGWICFGSRGNGAKQFILGFTGGTRTVEAFQAYCQRYCPTRATIHPNGPIFRFVVTDWFAFDVARQIFHGARTFLPRKRDTFNEATEYFRRRTRRIRNW
jgi:hypothetical protein